MGTGDFEYVGDMSKNNGKRRPFEFLYRGMSRANPWSPFRLEGHDPKMIIIDDIESKKEKKAKQKALIKSITEFGKHYGLINENKIKTNMETLNVTKANALKAYDEANDKGKTMLSNLFGRKVFIKDIRERIKSYQDACEYFNIKPLELSDFDFLPLEDRAYHYHDHRMVTIIRALNEGWVADHSDSNQAKYYVWYKWVGSGRGFSFGGYDCVGSSSVVGARHEFKSIELAKYFANQFIGEVNGSFIIK